MALKVSAPDGVKVGRTGLHPGLDQTCAVAWQQLGGICPCLPPRHDVPQSRPSVLNNQPSGRAPTSLPGVHGRQWQEHASMAVRSQKAGTQERRGLQVRV